jgi:hypothetical protein
MGNREEAICLRCGDLMQTEPRLVDTEPVRWLDDYPGTVRWHIREVER